MWIAKTLIPTNLFAVLKLFLDVFFFLFFSLFFFPKIKQNQRMFLLHVYKSLLPLLYLHAAYLLVKMARG